MEVARRARSRRLDADLSQQGLAERSGVSLASLRRFERTGQVSFEALVRIAWALDATGGVDALFAPPPLRSLDELRDEPRRQRGRGR